MQGILQDRYEKHTADRQMTLNRAREASKLTIPSLIPDDGHNETTAFESPWQSLGARGTNNLASKIILALFPPSTPFFRMAVDDQEMVELGARRGQMEELLATYERIVVSDIEDSKTRTALFQSIKHLIVGGNALLYNDKTGATRMYPLSRYVVKRDSMGEVYEIIATDRTLGSGLTPEVFELLNNSTEGVKPDEDVTIYTGIFRDGPNRWKVWQEIKGVRLPMSEGTYTNDSNPWIPLRWTAVDGESYGRGYVADELYGDLNSYDTLQQAITESSAAGALLRFLVDPNGNTDPDDLVDSDNGAFVTGREQDVTPLVVGKYADLRVALEAARDIAERLSFAFLLHSSVQRDAERVTAEEVRFMASELEDALGGLYSVLSQELQMPMVRYRIAKLTKERKLPTLPKEIKPTITTGLEALGRGHELQRLRMFINDAAQTFGPEVVAQYTNVSEYLSRSAAALNISGKNDLVKSEQQVQAEREQQAEQAAAIAAQQATQQGGQ